MTDKDSIIDELRLIGAPGTNKIMAGEMSRLAKRAFTDVRLPAPRKDGLGALAYPFDARAASLAVSFHRTSSRVLWGLYRSKATRLEPLFDDLLEAVRKDSRGWLHDGATISVSPANTHNFAAGGRQIVGVVKNAIIEGAASRNEGRMTIEVDPNAPDIQLEARMHDDALIVSMDLAGRSMNQRGYRCEQGEAPLRENLAAVLVMLSRYDARNEILIDPMAGSGTIAIEAACMAKSMPVWVPPREPAAKRHPLFKEYFAVSSEPLFADTRPAIIANEVDLKVYGMSKANAENADVDQYIESWRGDFREIDSRRIFERAEKRGFSPKQGVILSNPPYGERLSPGKTKELYRDLGEWCRQFNGWRAAFLMANDDFESSFGGRPRIKKPLSNGPLRGYFYLYDL